jgi:hypothetical protein
MKNNGHAQDGDALSQKEWQQALNKHQQSRIEKKAPRISAPQIKSMDGIIDSRVHAALFAFTKVFTRREAEHVHKAIDKAVAQLRDELREGLLSDLSRVIETQAQLSRDADLANTAMIVRALLATKKIVFDSDGRPLGLEVIE